MTSLEVRSCSSFGEALTIVLACDSRQVDNSWRLTSRNERSFRLQAPSSSMLIMVYERRCTFSFADWEVSYLDATLMAYFYVLVRGRVHLGKSIQVVGSSRTNNHPSSTNNTVEREFGASSRSNRGLSSLSYRAATCTLALGGIHTCLGGA